MYELHRASHRVFERFGFWDHQPVYFRFAPEPCHLPLGEPSGIAFEEPDHFHLIAFAGQIGGRMPVAQSREAWIIPPVASSESMTGLFQEPVGNLPVDALFNA